MLWNPTRQGQSQGDFVGLDKSIDFKQKGTNPIAGKGLQWSGEGPNKSIKLSN